MKQLFRTLSVSTLAFTMLFVSPRSVFAASCSTGGLQNPIGFCSLGEFLVALLGIAIQIATPLIILFIVYIGFRFVQESAAGNAEKMKDLRGYFVWAIVGALIVLGAQVLASAIQATVGELQG